MNALRLVRLLLVASSLAMLGFLYLFLSRNAPGLSAMPAFIAMAIIYALVYLFFTARVLVPENHSTNGYPFSGGLVLVISAMLIYVFLDSTVTDYYQPLSLYDEAIAALALWWSLLILAGLISLFAVRVKLPALVGVFLVALISWPLAASLWWLNNPEVGDKVADHRHIFTGGEDGYDVYRIPGLTLIPSGSILANGETLVADRILAFAEARRDGALDNGAIDLVLKISNDRGVTWNEQTVICRHQVGGLRGKCGNPTPLFDRITGRLSLAYNLSGLEEDTRNHSSHVMVSEDGGLNWGGARELANDNFIFGPGKGMQKLKAPHRDRLLLPGYAGGVAYLMFSDDHGANWQRSAGLARADETDVAERADGSLYMATRHQAPVSRAPEPNGRQFSISVDGGSQWTALQLDERLPTPVCQASVIYTGGDSLVFSNPAHPRSRARMTIRHSPDGGVTWDNGLLVYPGPSAYSVLARGSDGSVYLLYENGIMAYSERISLARIEPEMFKNTKQGYRNE